MEKINLAKLPTPLDYYGELFGNRVFIKRDDLTDLLLGGNKARKLEYFLHDAIKKEADVLVTYGSPQSNHCRMTAAAANKIGMECLLVLSQEDNINYNGNFLLNDLLDAEIRWTTLENVSETIQLTLDLLCSRGKKPYFIQGGGHGYLGTHAYVEAYNEMIHGKENIDYIFHATGTGTTQAGLLVGSLLNNSRTKIVGISIARKVAQCRQVISESIVDYFEHNNINSVDFENKIFVEDDYIGEGYADIYPDIIKTIKQVLKKSTILLDPVYTGKAFYGMLNYLIRNNITNKDVVFIHTGGTPLVFNYSDKFQSMALKQLNRNK